MANYILVTWHLLILFKWLSLDGLMFILRMKLSNISEFYSVILDDAKKKHLNRSVETKLLNKR